MTVKDFWNSEKDWNLLRFGDLKLQHRNISNCDPDFTAEKGNFSFQGNE
jgi:hypothetical protein